MAEKPTPPTTRDLRKLCFETMDAVIAGKISPREANAINAKVRQELARIKAALRIARDGGGA